MVVHAHLLSVEQSHDGTDELPNRIYDRDHGSEEYDSEHSGNHIRHDVWPYLFLVAHEIFLSLAERELERWSEDLEPHDTSYEDRGKYDHYEEVKPSCWG